MSEKNLSPKSDMRIRKMLCLHQMFRRKPHVVFNHPEGKLWDDYVNALCEVRDDADLNMDYQWEGKLGDKEQYIVRADGLKGEVRPGNPRLEEACHMASLRPSIQDMEQGTDIFHNAVKEYPTLLHREALLKACCEIYVAIDRDLYFFIGAVDK
ncbi:hypothetical protein IJ556_00220, partial [bacterium]|nr:hypothetical protein [bacterium]